MAVPSQPAHALDVGEVWRRAPAVPSPPPTDHSPHLGRLAMSHINGRAGWWKSPSPDLARGRGGQPPGLLYSVSRLSLLLDAAAAQTARTSASRLTAYASSQQTAASHAADACAAMSCALSSSPAALWGSTKSRSGTSTCDSSQSISATRFALMRTLPGLLGLPWTTHV